MTEDFKDSLLAFAISELAHHLDLFFLDKNNTETIIDTQELEANGIRRLVDEKTKRQRRREYITYKNKNRYFVAIISFYITESQF